MKTRTLVCLCGALAAWPLVEASAQAPALTPRDAALHALNRLAYGPRPGEVDRVAADGVMRWVDRQLSPRKIDDGPLAARERRFKILDYDAGELARVYVDAQRERREQKRAAATDSMTEKPEQAGPLEQRGRRLGAEFQELAVIRAVLSERQLYEVMVDFWTNHFNVYFAKGADRFLTPDYIEHTIRPRAMGKFEDLLIATAKSPAMLFYLDNWESVAPGASPSSLSARRRGGQGVRRMPKGINENYARELLELHTLGVDGGYTQHDVQELARVLTGLGVNFGDDAPRIKPALQPYYGRRGLVEFNPARHDFGDKQVLGQTVRGTGIAEIEQVLDRLARHPSTARFVSRKIAQYFVADAPPPPLVERMARRFLDSDGRIAAVLQTMVESPEFNASLGAKFKDPLHYVVSAVRLAYDDKPILNTGPMLGWLNRLGEAPYNRQTPDGYPLDEVAWAGPGQMSTRFEVARAIGGGSAGLF